MIIAKVKLKVKSNYMSKEDFNNLKGYCPTSKWSGTSYEDYIVEMSKRKQLVNEHFEIKKMVINTDDIEIAKFHLNKVEGLLEVIEIYENK